jgi:hypothetical protein
LLVLLAAVLLAGCGDLFRSGQILVYEERREWTSAVYMAADNELDSAALEDLNELEAVAYAGKPVTVLALVDRISAAPGNWSDTRLYEIRHDPGGKNSTVVSARLDGMPELGISAGTSSELDTASGPVLSGFIDYAKRAYPADQYGLVVWGHGLGWKGCAIDATSGNSMALAAFGGAVAGKGLSVIAFDTDYGATLEAAYEMRNAARYLAGSPGPAPDPEKGWDYRRLVAGFMEKPELSAEAFCESVAEQFSEQYGGTAGAAVSVVDLTKVNALFEAFEAFGGTAAAGITGKAAKDSWYDRLRNGTVSLYHAGEYPADACADLYSFSLQGNGTALREALGGAVKSWSKENGTERALLGVFVNRLVSPDVFATSHESGYRRGSGTGAFVKESEKWVPTGNTGGTSFLDKVFYGEYN